MTKKQTQSIPKTNIAKTVDFLDSWLTYRTRFADTVGLSVAVMVKDELIFSRAYGWSEPQKDKLTTQHLFSIGSQTKMLTALAIMQLVEKNVIKLDAPVSTYLPWLRTHTDKRFCHITVKQLLCHTSGLSYVGIDNNYWLFRSEAPRESDFVQAITRATLDFAPGTSVRYSNFGYALLGLVCEAVSGQPYTEHIENMLAAMNVGGVTVGYPVPSGARVAQAYGIPQPRVRAQLSPRRPLGVLTSAAGAYATPETMCALAATMSGVAKGVLTSNAKKQMYAVHSETKEGINAGWQFGLGVMRHYVGNQLIVGHDGHVGGHVTATFFDPERQWSVSVSANNRDMVSASVARGVFSILHFFLQSQAIPGTMLEGRFANENACVSITYNGTEYAAIDPGSWEPFDWYERLEKVNDTSLKVVTAGSLFNFGESVCFEFDRGQALGLRFAGISFKADKIKNS